MSCSECLWTEALGELDLPKRLPGFNLRVVGTLPLGIAMPDSDIDIILSADPTPSFVETISCAFRDVDGFALRRRDGLPESLLAKFVLRSWKFELFVQNLPVEHQYGWRHFVAERRLLEMGGPNFRRAVMRQRHEGLKTEPAFAAVLGLMGDPYQAIAELCDAPTFELSRLLQKANV